MPRGQPLHPGQSQVIGPELLGSSASGPWLGGQAPSAWRMIPEAAFNRWLCRVHQPCCNSSQQLSQAALQSEADAKDPEPPAKGVQKQSPSNINCLNATFSQLHPSVSSQGPTGSPASGAGPDRGDQEIMIRSCGPNCGPSPLFHPKSHHAKQLVPSPSSGSSTPAPLGGRGKQKAMADEGTAARSSEPPLMASEHRTCRQGQGSSLTHPAQTLSQSYSQQAPKPPGIPGLAHAIGSPWDKPHWVSEETQPPASQIDGSTRYC